jgi:hypothetical protein
MGRRSDWKQWKRSTYPREVLATGRQVVALVKFGVKEDAARMMTVEEACEAIQWYIEKIEARKSKAPQPREAECFRITERFLHSMTKKPGAYTREILEELGVKWPPRKGWKKRLIGLEAQYCGRELIIYNRDGSIRPSPHQPDRNLSFA